MFKILVALNNTPQAFKALDYAVSLAQKLSVPHQVIAGHFVGLNPQQAIPYIDHLEKAYNLEIEADAEKEVDACKKYVAANVPATVNHEFVIIEGEGDTGELIQKYVEEQLPDVSLVVVGTRNHGTLERWVLGSVSDFCVHHLHVPVTVVKE